MADALNSGTNLHVSRGDPFRGLPAGWINETTQRNADVRKLLALLQGAGKFGAPNCAQTVVKVKNTSGAARAAGEILGIGGNALSDPTSTPTDPQTSAFLFNPILTGEKPTLSGDFNNFAVCLEPIDKNAVGRACISGLCAAWVNILNSQDLYCDVTDNDATQLTSGSDGAAQIKYATGTSGKKLCWIQIGAGIFQGAPFYVSVKGNGGVNGTNKTTTCTRTYDLYPLGNTSGTKYNTSALSPKRWRFTETHYTDGTVGLAVRDGSAAFVLLDAIDETPDSAACS